MLKGKLIYIFILFSCLAFGQQKSKMLQASIQQASGGGGSTTYSIDYPAGAGNYPNNDTQTWSYSRSNALFFVEFTSLDTESGFDYIRFYQGTDNTGTLLDEYSGTTTPIDKVYDVDNLFIEFTSDGATTATGFVLDVVDADFTLGTEIYAVGNAISDGAGNEANNVTGLNNNGQTTLTSVASDDGGFAGTYMLQAVATSGGGDHFYSDSGVAVITGGEIYFLSITAKQTVGTNGYIGNFDRSTWENVDITTSWATYSQYITATSSGRIRFKLYPAGDAGSAGDAGVFGKVSLKLVTRE